MWGQTTDHASPRLVVVAVVLEVTDVTVAVVVVSVVVDVSLIGVTAGVSLMGVTADVSLMVVTTASLSWSQNRFRTYKVHQPVGHRFPPNVMLSSWQVADVS
jgi:hypothetical protein